MLRCKKGDMAIVLDPHSTAYGWLVDVGDFEGNCFAHDTVRRKMVRLVNAWNIKHSNLTPEFPGWLCEDSNLLPIRPDELKETEEREKEMAHE